MAIEHPTVCGWFSHENLPGWWCNVPILKDDGPRQWVSDDIATFDDRMGNITPWQHGKIHRLQIENTMGFPVENFPNRMLPNMSFHGFWGVLYMKGLD